MRQTSRCGRREFLCALPLAIAAGAAAVQAEEKPTSLPELQEQLKSEKRATVAAAFAELEERAKTESEAGKILDAYLERRKEFFERCRISIRDGEPFPRPKERPRGKNELVFESAAEIPLTEMHLVYSLPTTRLIAVSRHFTDQHVQYFAKQSMEYLVLESTAVTGATLGELDLRQLSIAWFTGTSLAEEHFRKLEFPRLELIGVSATPVTNHFLKEVRAPKVVHFLCGRSKIDADGLKLLPTAFPELATLQIGIKLANKETLERLYAENPNLNGLTIRCAAADFDQVVELKRFAKGRIGIEVEGVGFEELRAIHDRFRAAQPKPK